MNYRRDTERYQYENQELSAQVIQFKTTLERERLENETLAKQLKEVRDDARRRIDALERRNQEIEADHSVLNSQIKSVEGTKHKNQDQAETIRKLQHDLKRSEQETESLEQQLQKVQDSKTDVERRCESLRREIDLLTQDKNYLQRENTTLEDKVRRIEDKLDKTEMSLLESKKQAEKYMDRVLNTNDDLKSKFD